jgi:HAMP domain-containing protein
MSKGDIISSVIAAVSAVIAGISLFVAARFARRQTRLQERVTKIEEGRWGEEVEAKRHAQVIPQVTWREDSAAAELVLLNHGPAEARSVGFTLSAASKGNVPDVADTELLPLSVLHPGVPMSFWISLDPMVCRVLLVRVAWTDDAGPHEKPYKLRVMYD